MEEKEFDNLYNNLCNISKAHGYDILAKDIKVLKEQNEKLLQDKRELLDLLHGLLNIHNDPTFGDNVWRLKVAELSQAAIEKHSK